MSVIRTKNRIQFAEDFVLNNGKIGIATNDPQQTLDVVGNIGATGLVTASQLSAGLYQGEVRFLDNVFIDGNITIAGTSAVIDTQTLRIEDADIILGFTTNQNGDEVSTDTTANHGGIAIASTEGTPLSRVVVTGIETLPSTYKKIMWFKSDTFSGVSTDAWMINYGVSIGNTTNVPTGTRLAAGDVLISQDDITAVRNVNATGIITGNTADFNSYTDLNVTGASSLGSDVSISGDLEVTGVSTFNSAININENGVFAGTISSTFTQFGGVVTWPELESANVNADLSDPLTLVKVTSSGNGWTNALSTISTRTSGKYYAEVTVNSAIQSDYIAFGVRNNLASGNVTSAYNFYVGRFENEYGLRGAYIINNNQEIVAHGFPFAPAQGQVIGILLNLDDNEITFSQNGTLGNTVAIASGLNYQFAVSVFTENESLTVNFGETPFTYTPPAGYQGLFETTPYVEVDQDGLDFVGDSTFADDVTISGDLNVIGNISTGLDISGDLDLSGNLNVSGVSTFNDTVTFKPDGVLVGIISSTSQYLGKKAQSVELESPNSSAALSNNNLTLTSSDTSGFDREGALSTLAATSGKIYTEITIDAVDNAQLISYGIVGVSQIDPLGPFDYDGYFGNSDENSIGMRGDNDFVRYNGGPSLNGAPGSGIGTDIVQGDVMGVLLDLDANQLAFSYNGFVGNFVDISAYDDPLGFKIGATVNTNNQQVTFNFGETAFAYEPPAGYVGLYNETPYVEVDNSGLDFVGVSTFTDTAIFDSTGSIQIPVGTTAERPGIAVTGQIRYNTENSSFEGYGPGGAWGSLGGVKDVDGDTYILAETSAGSDEDILYFYTGGELTGTISTTNGITGDGENIRSVYAPKAAAASYASYSETSNSALSIAGIATYNQVSKISASGNTGFMRVGQAIDGSHDGKTIVVGAYDKLTFFPGGNDAGAVYVYDREGNSFNEVGILTGPTVSNAQYGWDVSTTADAKTIVIGARSDQLSGGNNAGKVYVYDRVGNDFNLVGILTGSLAGTSGDYFGSSVSISGNGKTLVVGAEQDETDVSPINSGVVYVYDRVGNDFNQVGILTGSFQSAGDIIGKQVDISYDGNVIVAGGDLANYQGVADIGVAFVFERTGNTFNELTFLTGNELSDRFAHRISVSDDGNTIAISAERGDADGGSTVNVGEVYVYGRDGNNYNEIAYLTGSQTPFGITNSAKFVFPRLSADGNTLVVGDNVLNIAYVYERQGNTFNEVTYLTGSDTDSAFDQFGNDVFITADGKTIYIGSPVQEDVVYAFDREQETYVYSDASGNIGIGSAIPTTKLDVAGDVNAKSFIGDGENIRSVYAPEAALASYASHSATSNSALSIAGLSTYTEVGKFTGSRSGSSDDFGNALAVSADGKTIVVGAINDEFSVGASGLAYVFDREGNNFNQVGILSALPSNTDTNDRFGYSVAISDDGKTIAVGADRDEAPGSGSESGVVYVYDRVGSDFNRVGILTGSLASDGNDNFGSQVALNGDGKTLIVGAPADETNTISLPGQGVAYVFDKVGTTYNQVGILTATVGYQDASDKFGTSVQVSSDGKTIAVGAEEDEIGGSGNFAHGLVYIFDRNGSSFEQVGILTGTYAQDLFDDFGAIKTLALSANGRTIAVGAPSDEISGSAEGLVYVFDRVGDTFSEVGILTGSYVESNEFFGKAVAINADGTVIAAATGAGDELPGGTSTGVVYVFNRQGNQFNEIAAFVGSDTTTGNVFGSSLGISADGKSVIVGAESGGANSGQVYVFDEEKETYVYSDAEGNIGIGSAIPTAKLDVAGDIRVSGTILGSNLNNVSSAGTFTASPGVPYTIDSYTIAVDNLKTAEYTLHIENDSNIQSQKLLVMQNGTTAFSQEYAIMFDPDEIGAITATLTGGAVNVQITPEPGVTGLTTYRYIRQSIS